MLDWIRNLDIRKVAVGLGILAAVAHGVVSGQVPLDHLFPASWGPYIIAWLGVYLYVFPLIVGAHSYTATSWTDPATAQAKQGGPTIRGAAVIAFLIGAAALFEGVGGAHAADMPAKAPPPDFQVPFDTSGWYGGVGTVGGGGSVAVSAPGVNSNSLVSNQIGVYALIGYAWNIPNSPMSMAIDQLVGYVDFNGAQQGLSFHGPLDFETRFLIGAPLDQIAAFFPNFGIKMPTFNLPTGFTAKSTKFYLGGAFHVSDESLNFGQSQGRTWGFAPAFIPIDVRTLLTNGSAIDAWTEVRLNDQGLCAQGGGVAQNACGRVNTAILAGVAYEFGVYGPSFGR